MSNVHRHQRTLQLESEASVQRLSATPWRRGLTSRSTTGPATAATVWPLQAQVGIVLARPAGVRPRSPVSSNVWRHVCSASSQSPSPCPCCLALVCVAVCLVGPVQRQVRFRRGTVGARGASICSPHLPGNGGSSLRCCTERVFVKDCSPHGLGAGGHCASSNRRSITGYLVRRSQLSWLRHAVVLVR